MIEQKFVDRFARNSGIKDKFIAEREVILTYALEAIKKKDLMKHLAFKGGTALRKLVFGSSGRFSMDLDFTLYAVDQDRDDILEQIISVFNGEHHHITFKTDDFYFTEEETSFGGDVRYSHAWNNAGVFKLQISLREEPTLPIVEGPLQPQEYFKEMEFKPFSVCSLAVIEMISEKLRAAFQRSKVRDLYDLYRFATTPFDAELLRSLVVLKLWQTRNSFEPVIFFEKIRGADYEWEDLTRLVRQSETFVPEEIIKMVESRFSFLKTLTDLEHKVVMDSRGWKSPTFSRRLREQIIKRQVKFTPHTSMVTQNGV